MDSFGDMLSNLFNSAIAVVEDGVQVRIQEDFLGLPSGLLAVEGLSSVDAAFFVPISHISSGSYTQKDRFLYV